MDQTKGKQFILHDSLMFNFKQLELLHIVICILAGCISGILGLTGVQGLILLAAVFVSTTFADWARMKFNTSRYLVNSILDMESSMFSGQCLTYILFWTSAFALVHIY